MVSEVEHKICNFVFLSAFLILIAMDPVMTL